MKDSEEEEAELVAREEPRRSVAFTFRRASAGLGFQGLQPLTAADLAEAAAGGPPPAHSGGNAAPSEGMGLERRLRLVAQSLLLYSRWFSLDGEGALPAVFWARGEGVRVPAAGRF